MPALNKIPLLVVAGEASGDVLAAGVVEHLNTKAIGMGGPQLSRVGAELVVRDPSLASMGPLHALRNVYRYKQTLGALDQLVTSRTPKVALLVGFSAFNARLGKRLRRRGLRVLWYAPAQVWAWRPQRIHSLSKSCDRVAVILPFEEQLWRGACVEADYVGHPSYECRYRPREELRSKLGWNSQDCAIALLPGSRSGEVRRLLVPMLEGLEQLKRGRKLHARLLLADALSHRDTSWALQLAQAKGVLPLMGCSMLPAFDAAFAASGTVTLDCALAGVPPVITYRTDVLTAWLAEGLLETPHIGLPNIILGSGVFPEVLQAACNAETLARGVQPLLDHPGHFRRSCLQVRKKMTPPGGPTASERVAHMLEAWLN